MLSNHSTQSRSPETLQHVERARSELRPAGVKKRVRPGHDELAGPLLPDLKTKLKLPEVIYMVHTSQRASRARPSTNTERAVTVSVVPLKAGNF
jgi:hypothetical protein